MCTLIVSFEPQSTLPLLIAANRDERLDRPSSAPRVWAAPMPFIAPLDEQAGGTWLGLNAAGLFVGVTNRFGVEKDPARASRGKLVIDSLGASTARALHQTLSNVAPHAFNAFHLLYADQRDAFVTWCDGEKVMQQSLAPGLHIVTERSLGGDDRARTETLRSAWTRTIDREAPSVAALHALLSLHNPDDPLGAPCVHVPAFNYGTRSSLILLLPKDAAASRMYWAEGAPCTHPHVDQQTLLAQLGATPSRSDS